MEDNDNKLRKSFISQLEFFAEKFQEVQTFPQYMDCLIDADKCVESMINRLTQEDMWEVGPKIQKLAYESVVAAVAINYPKDSGATLEGVQMKLYNFLDLTKQKITLKERTWDIYRNIQKMAAKESARGNVFTYKFWDKIALVQTSGRKEETTKVQGKFLTNGMSHN